MGIMKQDQEAIHDYVTKYATKHNITYEQALQHKIVQNVITWMNLRRRGQK